MVPVIPEGRPDLGPQPALVALLRGINVGGRHKVTMAELRAALTARGLTGVRTYIASGNVILDPPPGPDPVGHARAVVEEAIVAEFGFSCSVLVRTGGEIRRIAEAVPAEWLRPELRADVLYLFDTADRPEVVEEVTLAPHVDTVSYVPGALLWCVPRDRLTRSRLPRIVGTPLYPLVTVRNARTALALADLAQPTGG